MNSNKRNLMISSIVLLVMLVLLPLNTVHSAKHELSELPSGGHTIIIGDIAYSKEYLEANRIILSNALEDKQTVYVKLDEEIYINQKGEFLVDLSEIPAIRSYFYEVTDIFEVLSIR